MSRYSSQSILLYFSHLFVLCKILGIYPYNLQIFQNYHELKKSTIGTISVLIAMFIIIILYNLLIFSFSERDNTLKASQSTLTFVIGIFLTYIGLVMMATDQLTAIRNQNSLGQLYDRICIVDDRISQEGCIINNKTLRKRISVMIFLVFIFEITIMISGYTVLIDHTKLKSLLWLFSCFPTLYNSLDKIWFATTLYALQQRFLVINNVLNAMVEEHEQYKENSDLNRNEIKNNDKIRGIIRDVQEENLNFLYSELSRAPVRGVVKQKIGKNRITPISVVSTPFNNLNKFSTKKNNQKKVLCDSQLNNVMKVEEKFNNFCQIHDELCEIGKMLNELWNYPILMLMAYGFLIFTAQLYFLYCSTQEQDIPTLFLSAKSAFITVIFLVYTAGKCVYLIFLSWKTSMESRRTGIYLHKCGVVADDNELYEIINHLSLKLLNHSVDFSACGFFSLDMETLYGISGGITSYLIILIQFNLAAQQAKEAMNSYSNSRNSDMDSEEQSTTTSLTHLISSTMATMISSEI